MIPILKATHPQKSGERSGFLRRAPRLFLLLAGMIFTGCAHNTDKVTMPVIRPEDMRRVETTPVLDTHTHTFNSLSLPLKEIVLGKRDKAGVASVLLPDALVNTFTSWVVAKTRSRQDKSEFQTSDPAVQEIEDRLGGGGDLADRLSFRETIMAKVLFGFFSEHADPDATDDATVGSSRTPRTPRTSLGHFLDRICEPDTRQRANFLADCGDPDGKTIQFMISHTMDLAPVYDQEEGTRSLWSFPQKVLPRMRELVGASGGGMGWFVAWNPYRDHWTRDSSAGQGHALGIVRQGVALGALGVKFYPPSGYRPFGNEMKSRPLSPLASEPRRQWKARYPLPAAEMNALLDNRCLELFRWCAANNVPIFSHCSTGEFEARSGYGVHHAHPEHWAELLQKNPDLHDLRLCLAHAGGEDHWFGGGKFAAWGKVVARLCREYPNVYCEFGSHSNILGPAARAHFAMTLAAEIRAPGRYPFAKKIMYGSDWFMPLGRGSFAAYLRGFQASVLEAERLLLSSGTPQTGLYEDFMLRNSLRYLDAARRKSDSRLLPGNRAVLARLVAWRPE